MTATPSAGEDNTDSRSEGEEGGMSDDGAST